MSTVDLEFGCLFDQLSIEIVGLLLRSLLNFNFQQSKRGVDCTVRTAALPRLTEVSFQKSESVRCPIKGNRFDNDYNLRVFSCRQSG